MEAPIRDLSPIAFCMVLKYVNLPSSSSLKPVSCRLVASHTPPVKSTKASAMLPASNAS